MASMKQVIGYPSPEIDFRIETGPIPEPGDDQVRIKVVVSGSNPKDWKVPTWAAAYDGPDDDGSWQATAKRGINQGDDVAGIVDKVGKNVITFKEGDRVAGYHMAQSTGGSYAEYALAPEHTTFHLPPSTSFEEAATLPLAMLTAAVSLFSNLRLPTPWLSATQSTPLVIYGASTAVGSFAIKLSSASNIHPIIAVAGKGAAFVETLLDRRAGDAVFDYRAGADEVVKGIRAHLKAGNYGDVRHGVDPGIGGMGQTVLTAVVASGGAIDLVLPADWDTGSAVKTTTIVGSVHGGAGFTTADDRDLGLVTCRWLTNALQRGAFTGHPFEVRAGGLAGVPQALQDLKDGKNSASKYVFCVADTPGL